MEDNDLNKILELLKSSFVMLKNRIQQLKLQI